MAKRTANHLKKHQFKPGAPSGNPNGRPPLTPEQRALKTLTLKDHCDIITKVLTGTKDDLEAMLKDPCTTSLQLVLIKTVIRGISEGDYGVIRELIEQIIGKIPIKMQITNDTRLDANVVFTEDKIKELVDKARSDVK